jgi:hypothetical protein
LVDVPSVQVSVPAVLHTVHRLPVAAVVAAPLHDLTRLVESVAGTAAAPEIVPRVAATSGTSLRVVSPARHAIRSARAAPIGAVSSAPETRTAATSIRQQKPGPRHGPGFPVPAPLNSCVSCGHGGTPTAAFLAAAHPAGPFGRPVRFVADEVGGEDNAARPGVTPD